MIYNGIIVNEYRVLKTIAGINDNDNEDYLFNIIIIRQYYYI